MDEKHQRSARHQNINTGKVPGRYHGRNRQQIICPKNKVKFNMNFFNTPDVQSEMTKTYIINKEFIEVTHEFRKCDHSQCKQSGFCEHFASLISPAIQNYLSHYSPKHFMTGLTFILLSLQASNVTTIDEQFKRNAEAYAEQTTNLN